jgi:hypothetical protein
MEGQRKVSILKLIVFNHISPNLISIPDMHLSRLCQKWLSTEIKMLRCSVNRH